MQMFNKIPCKQKNWRTYHASIHHDLSSTHLFLHLDGPQIGKDDEQSKQDKNGQGDAFEDPYWPSLKQTVGSVVSWKPAHMALRTAPLSNLPEIRQDHTWNVEHYMMLDQEIWRKWWLNMAQDNCIQWSTFTKNKITSLALEITRCMQFWGYPSMTGAPSYGRLGVTKRLGQPQANRTIIENKEFRINQVTQIKINPVAHLYIVCCWLQALAIWSHLHENLCQSKIMIHKTHGIWKVSNRENKIKAMLFGKKQCNRQ